MTLSQLEKWLHDAGCSSTNYHIGEPKGVGDVYCLARRNGRWQIFYTERGQDSPPEKTFNDEAEACQYFYDFVLKMRHLHLVGFYKSQKNLQQHAHFLQQEGITTSSDQIPYGGSGDWRYRLFVEGKAIFAVRQLQPNVPLTDAA